MCAAVVPQVESGSMVAAGAVVEAGTTVPSGELWAGNPARRVRALKQEEKDHLEALPERWGELQRGGCGSEGRWLSGRPVGGGQKAG